MSGRGWALDAHPLVCVMVCYVVFLVDTQDAGGAAGAFCFVGVVDVVALFEGVAGALDSAGYFCGGIVGAYGDAELGAGEVCKVVKGDLVEGFAFEFCFVALEGHLVLFKGDGGGCFCAVVVGSYLDGDVLAATPAVGLFDTHAGHYGLGAACQEGAGSERGCCGNFFLCHI